MTRSLPSSPRRRTTAAFAALLLGLTLAACGGGDDDAGDDPTPRASESTSSESTPDEPTSSATEEAPAAVPTEAELEAALLTTADVPEGFTVSPDDGEDDESGFDGTCLADIGEFSEALGSEPDEDAEVELSAETATTQAAVSSKISAYADPSAVGPTFATFTDQLQGCTSVSATEDGVTYDLAIAYDDTVDLPGVDDQLAFDVTGTIASGDQSYPVSYRYVVAVAGPFLSVVGAYTVGEDTTGIVDTTKDLAVLQAERVAGLG